MEGIEIYESIPITDEQNIQALDCLSEYFKLKGIDPDSVDYWDHPDDLPENVDKAWDIIDIANFNYLLQHELLFGNEKDGKDYILQGSEFVEYQIPKGVQKWMSEHEKTKKKGNN